MRNLRARLERLEQAAPGHEDFPVMWVRFFPDGPITAIRDGSGEALTRMAGEDIDAFKARALAHFEAHRLPRCGVVLLMDNPPENPPLGG